MTASHGPRRLQTRCRVPGCRRRTRNGYCDQHQQQRYQRDVDRYRGTAAQRGYDDDWRRLRDAYYRQHPFCEDCLEHGVHTTAHIEVDHVIPIAVRPDLRLEWTNLRSRCRSHHQAKSHRDRQTYGRNQAGTMTPRGQPTGGGSLKSLPDNTLPPASARAQIREIGDRGGDPPGGGSDARS